MFWYINQPGSILEFDNNADLIDSDGSTCPDTSSNPTYMDITQDSYTKQISFMKTSLNQISADISSIDDDFESCEYISDSVL